MTDVPKLKWDTDISNEQTILSHAIVDINLVRGEVQIEDFLLNHHKIIYWTLLTMAEKEVELSLNTFATLATECPYGEDYGGNDYLKQIRSKYNEEDNLSVHVRKLKKDKEGVKTLRDTVPGLIDVVFDSTKGVDDLHDFLLKQANILATQVSSKALSGDNLLQYYRDEYKKRIESRRIKCGFKTIDDRLVWGFAPGSMTVLAGRTSHNKSTLCLNMANGFIDNGFGVFFATLEVDTASMMNRMIAATTSITHKSIITGNLIEEHMERKAAAEEAIARAPISFYDKRGCSMAELESEIIKAKIKHPVDVVLIDLFSYMREAYGDVHDLENALKEVRSLAYRQDVHPLLVVQIQRRAEDRADKKPQLRDIKWSGGYEESTDVALLLYRGDVYKRSAGKGDESTGILEVNIAKQRDGEIGPVALKCDDTCFKISDVDNGFELTFDEDEGLSEIVDKFDI